MLKLSYIPLVVLLSLNSLVQANCDDMFAKGASSSSGYSWRSKVTNPAADGSLVATSKIRESLIEAKKEDMILEILNDQNLDGKPNPKYDPNLNHGSPDTPEMMFFPAGNLSANYQHNYIVPPKGYTTGVIPRVQVSGIGSDGIFEATFLLPVSGHTGVANARKWSTTDRYSVYAFNGAYMSGSQGKQILADNVMSKDLITYQDIKMKMVKDQVIRIEYHRGGSLGPGGYSEGRVIEFVWDGT